MILLDDILKATSGRIFGPVVDTEFVDFCFDSRRVESGQLFLAVRTDKGDGHDYILDAIRGGATGVICQEPRGIKNQLVTCVLVENTETALYSWAKARLADQGAEVIAITGSVGKTGTKEAVAAVLSKHFSVFRNHGSYNGLFGLPIALGRLQPEHELAVLELGSDHLGEIAALADMTSPRVGIVTGVSAAHLEAFGTLDEIAKEKGSLIDALPQCARGLAILNWDDQRVRQMSLGKGMRSVNVGLQAGADIRATNVKIDLTATRFKVNVREACYSATVPWLGQPRVFSALAALAVGLEFGISIDEIIESLATLPLLPGRLNAIPAINDSTLIDDTFNSSPAAAIAALDLLAELECPGRRIAVLGDMYQLGETTVMEHRRIGSYAAGIVDELIVKGELASEIGRGAEDAGMPDEQIVYAYSNEQVIRHLETVQREKVGEASSSNLILVKGSALTRLEQVSRALLAHPERDKEKLVRQDPVFGQVVLTLPGRPTWVEVDVEATAYNCRRVKEIIGPSVILLAVLKADAYGHGAHRLARVVLSNGAEFLGVASLNEGITLRDAGIKAPILILGYSPAWSARQALLNEMTVTLFDLAVARAFDRAAAELGRRAEVHIKVDTGMGRLGLLPSQVVPFFLELEQYANIDVTGIFTHFSVADSTDPLHTDHTDVQLDRFRKILSDLDAIGKTPPIVHCANSAAILSRPETHFDMVRLGIALHGLDPSPAVPCPSDFKRALGFLTTVAQVKQYEAGTPISYGNTYKTEGKQTIAVLPVGYADGFRRAPAHWGEVLIRGSRASIVGRVTMDQTMVDVTHIPGVQIGDRVVLIGKQGRDEITVNDVADRLGTINYEVVSGILARVPRIT